jgi:hypothetical protein
MGFILVMLTYYAKPYVIATVKAILLADDIFACQTVDRQQYGSYNRKCDNA